jgi:flavin-dependent dehydrogenase
MSSKKPKIIIIGGGLAGLTSAILLAKADFEVLLIERKSYPFHRVCGEYVSNEVLPFLISLGIDSKKLGTSKITKLALSGVNGNQLKAILDLGGTGISRYKLDYELYEIAKKNGVNFILEQKVLDVRFENEIFNVELSNQHLKCDVVLGAFGKRSNLDQKLKRRFFYLRSPYIGVKYHVKIDFPSHIIQLDNFKGGYCGINKIEDNLYCLCYLAENKYLKKYGSIAAMEQNLLFQNTKLKWLFENAEFVWDKPEVINEISFQKKSLIENHILMIGDTAGMISPLCGNGMAMAIHSAKILSEQIIEICSEGLNASKRQKFEQAYQQKWNKEFATRLKIGRLIQNLFTNSILTNLIIILLKTFPTIAQKIIAKTHGKAI